MSNSSPLLTPQFLDIDDLTQECKDLTSTLPAHKGWLGHQIYSYQGFWYSARLLQAMLHCQEHFQARGTDVLLVTSPKCGTTWLKALAYAIVNRSRNHITTPSHPLLTTSPHDLVRFLELDLFFNKADPNPNLDDIILDPIRIFGTHLPYTGMPESVKTTPCKVVYLYRNPKDTFVSLWHFSNKLRPKEYGVNSIEEVFDMFCKGVYVFGPFWDHFLAYWKQSLEHPQKVLFLKYEEVKKDPSEQIRRLAMFLECPFSEEEEKQGLVSQIIELCSFDSLSNLQVNKTGKSSIGVDRSAFFRRGEVGDSMSLLTPEMVDRIDQITAEKLQGSGLEF